MEVLRRELDRPVVEAPVRGRSAPPPIVYQPIEGHYKLTRRSLEALAHARTPVGLITKGPMVVRDKDVLAGARRSARAAPVYFSVPTVDEDAWRTLEPGTAHPLQRLRAVRELNDAGIRAGVLMAPIVPGFTSQPAKLEATIKAIADHGAAFMGANVLYLKEGTRVHFMNFLEKHFPALSTKYQRCTPARTRPKPMRRKCRGWSGCCRAKYDVKRSAGEDRRQKRPDENRPAGRDDQVLVRLLTTIDCIDYRRFISAWIRCSVGGCVLNMLSSPPPENGFTMNMCAVAGFASSGICFDRISSLRSAFISPYGRSGDLGAAGIRVKLARPRDRRLHQHRRQRREDDRREHRNRIRAFPVVAGCRRRTSPRTAPCAPPS